jgi:photosystem II stability/assembly factor-like uncharacterized protein
MKLWTILLLTLQCLCVRLAEAQCQWTVQRGPDARTPVCIQFVDSLYGWIGRYRTPTLNDPLLRTTNGGATWDSVVFSQIAGTINTLSFIDRQRGWCVIDSRRVYRTADSGLSWTLIKQFLTTEPGISTIQFVDSLNGFAAGADSIFPWTRMRRTTDGGMSWHSTSIQTSAVYYRMKFVDALRGWTVGEQLYATTDGGATWHKQSYDSSTVGALYGVDFLNENEGWCCSNSNGWVIHTTNGGLDWVNQARIQPPNGLTMKGISFANSRIGFTFGFTFYQGDIMQVIHRTTDGGEVWEQQSLALSRWLENGTAVDKCHAWAISAGDGSILGLGNMTAVAEGRFSVPETLRLLQNYPNPYNPTTKIRYTLAKHDRVIIRVFDQLGKEVCVLVDAVQEAGDYSIRFDATDLTSGVYYFQLSTSTSQVVRRSLLLK